MARCRDLNSHSSVSQLPYCSQAKSRDYSKFAAFQSAQLKVSTEILVSSNNLHSVIKKKKLLKDDYGEGRCIHIMELAPGIQTPGHATARRQLSLGEKFEEIPGISNSAREILI